MLSLRGTIAAALANQSHDLHTRARTHNRKEEERASSYSSNEGAAKDRRLL